MLNYILDEMGNPIPEPDIRKWCDWVGSEESTEAKPAGARAVALSKVGNSTISTVFLGCDHAFGFGREPILWETMVFGGKLAGSMDRCSGSRKEAEKMHSRMLLTVKAGYRKTP